LGRPFTLLPPLLLLLLLRARRVCACADALASRARALGLASVSREHIDSSTLDTVSAGLHWSLRMSRQMPPLLFMLQW
jgi:hypothetical protein